jgi:hypothetical protein|eukprot:scaffold10550_cov271-Chaetoceros_neogracile.AAC.30
MAQGMKKTAGKKKSVAATRKLQSRKLSKGKKAFKAKGRSAALAKQETDTSKAINKKNEVTASSRAINSGNTFFLQELKDAGKKELQRRKRNQIRDEKKTNTLSSRLKDQLRKMGKDI